MWILPFFKLDGLKPSSLRRSRYFLAFPFFRTSPHHSNMIALAKNPL
jgi:hypothetical protein